MFSPQQHFEGIRYGIAGGTFDPVHLGHLLIAEDMRTKFGLERVLFIPSKNPPHKDLGQVTDGKARYEMVKLAIEGNPDFMISDIEMKRAGASYTVDTLRALKTQYGDPIRFCFLCGADVIRDIHLWKSPKEIFSMCDILTTTRHPMTEDEFRQKTDDLRKAYGARIYFADSPRIDISSTDIRERVKNGRSIKYMVPEAVEAYIYEHGLYRT